jgi:hypothetical protein
MAVGGGRAKSLFLAASDLVHPAERAEYLGRECGGDSELRDRVEALLRANDASPLPPLEPEVATIESDASDWSRKPLARTRPDPNSLPIPIRLGLRSRLTTAPPPAQTSSSPVGTHSRRRSAKAAWAKSGSPSSPSPSNAESR